MYLDVNGVDVHADIQNESTFSSKHTGAELKRIQVEVVAPDQQTHERLLEIKKKAKRDGISSTDGKGNIVKKWKIDNSIYSYTDPGPGSTYYHSIELEEMEELKVDNLLLNGLSFQPYSYHEKFSNDVLIIEAKVLLSEAEYSELRKLMIGKQYFPVIRQGISEETIEMRFGIVYWSRHENEIKHQLYLVERKYDEDDGQSRDLFQPEMNHMQHDIAKNIESIEGLMTVLVDKGFLDPVDVESIRKKVSEGAWDRRREFYLVKELDELL